MTTASVILDQLRLKGFRITKLRQGLLDVLSDATHPLSIQEMNEQLLQNGIRVNKTTIYREVDFLESQHLAHSVQFQEDLKRYELTRDHHHHLVCVQCGKIEDIQIKAFEAFFPELEKKLRTTQGFHLAHHSLELFGRCRNCVE